MKFAVSIGTVEPSGANSVCNYTSDLQYRTNTKRKSDLSITIVLEEPINEHYARLHRHDVVPGLGISTL